MTFRLACADFAFPLMTHEQSLKLIALLGFEGVDIGLFEGRSHIWPSKQFSQLEQRARYLKKQTDDLGLAIADLFLQMDPDFRPFAINHPDRQPRTRAREWFKCLLDYAAACDCGHVTVLPGVHFETESRGDSVARSAEELAWRIERSKPYNITIGTEPHVGSIVDTPAAVQRLVDATAGLTLTLDYTHFIRAGQTDNEVEPLLRHAGHFHVRGAAPGRLQVSFAQNKIDYTRIARLLHELDYRGWVGIEYIWIDWERCNECDNVSETIQFRDLFTSFCNHLSEDHPPHHVSDLPSV